MPSPLISVAFAELADELPESLLAPDEVERANAYKSTRRRQQFCLSRALTRALLEKHTGKPASSFTIATDSSGKPFIEGGPAFSVSHSRNIVTCVVADDGEVGIDLEFPGRKHDTPGIAKRFFSASEAEWLDSQPADRFYMLWVLKEAWLKAIGTGIAGGLDRLQCSVTPPAIEARLDGEDLESLQLFELFEGLLGIATTTQALNEVHMEQWQPANGQFAASNAAKLIARYPV